MDLAQLFVEDLLHERTIALAGAGAAELAPSFAELGARTATLAADPADEPGAEAEAAALGPIDALVVIAPPHRPDVELHEAAHGAWVAARSVANAAWIGEGRSPGGKIVFIAPAPSSAADHALRAAYENLSRTLSIEWARYGIRTTTITPGDATTDEEVASLVAYVVSPAGDYFSGARLDLGAV